MADHVRRPVLSHALADPAVQSLRGSPHDVGASHVAVGLLHHQSTVVDEHLQQSLGVAVLDVGVDAVRHVLLAHMHTGINNTVGSLARRQRHGGLGVQNSPHRVHQRRRHAVLHVLRSIGNDGVAVRLGSSSRESENDTERDSGLNGHTALADIAVVVRGLRVHSSGADELAAVGNRTTTDRKDEHVFRSQLLHDGNSLDQRLVVGVGLDAAELSDVPALESGHNLVVNAVALDGTTAIAHENLLVLGDKLRQLGNLALTKHYTSSVLVVKVQHRHNNKRSLGSTII